MSSGNVVPHTFAIENDIRRFSENVNGVHDILARCADSESNVEGHKDEGYTRW